MIQLVCSNCGADLKDLPIKGGKIVCPYCSAINEFKGIDGERELNSSEKTDRKIFYEPISLSVEDIDKICTDALAEDELAPDDIYQEISMNGYQLLYLPFCVIGGNYTYTCSYEQGGNHKSKNENKTIYKRFLVYTGSEVPMPLKEKINNSTKTSFNPAYFSADEGSIDILKKDNKCIVCEPNAQVKYFESILENDAKEQATKIQGATNVTITRFLSDFHADKIIYIPYYVVELNYKGQQYYIAACASSSGGLYSVLPVDTEREKAFKELADIGGPFFYLFAFLPFLLGLIWIFGPLTFGWFFWLSVLSWIICCIIVGYKTNRNKELRTQILEESRKKRLMHKI